jgi:hypothetical protein
MNKRDKPLALATETLRIFEMYCTTWSGMGIPQSSLTPECRWQSIQRVEAFSRSATDWIYHQCGAGQLFSPASLDVEIEVCQLYRRLSIPAVKEVEEEVTSGTELGKNE